MSFLRVNVSWSRFRNLGVQAELIRQLRMLCYQQFTKIWETSRVRAVKVLFTALIPWEAQGLCTSEGLWPAPSSACPFLTNHLVSPQTKPLSLELEERRECQARCSHLNLFLAPCIQGASPSKLRVELPRSKSGYLRGKVLEHPDLWVPEDFFKHVCKVGRGKWSSKWFKTQHKSS